MDQRNNFEKDEYEESTENKFKDESKNKEQQETYSDNAGIDG